MKSCEIMWFMWVMRYIKCRQQGEDWKENLTWFFLYFYNTVVLSLSLSVWFVVVSGGDRSTRPTNTHQCLCETENGPASAAADLQHQCVKFTLFSALLSRVTNRRDAFLTQWSPSSRGGAKPVAARDTGRGCPLGLRPPAPSLYDAANT